MTEKTGNMHEFERRVAHNIAARQLIEGERPVIVALSGGADSVSLLVSLSALGYQCVAAHCNYHLRGEESNRDMRYAQSLCVSLGVDLYVRDFDVEARRRAIGESVEMACRELRYAWFADLLDRLRAQAIAVAHHREDNLETFMLNLLRGSGIAGLTGMRWRHGYVVRPMLDLTRSEVEGYLTDKGIGYVDDSTNAESVYARNRLRNIILPMIDRQFPAGNDGILASMSHLADNKALYEALIAEKRAKYYSDGAWRLADLMKHESQARILLFELLRPMGFNMTQVDNIMASASHSGISFGAKGTVLELDRGVLYERCQSPSLATGQQDVQVSLRSDILSPAHVLVSEHSIVEFKPERDRDVAYFDVDMLSGSPRFALRRWQKGDKMHPYGMDGTRRLSDMFSDAKYSAADKREAWVLTRNDEIIWVLGLRASALFSIKPETRRYLRLQWRRQKPKN